MALMLPLLSIKCSSFILFNCLGDISVCYLRLLCFGVAAHSVCYLCFDARVLFIFPKGLQ